MRKIKPFILFAMLTIGMGKVYAQQNTINIFPNPFKDSTNISFYLVQDGKISIDIYNTIGQKVGTSFQDTSFTSGSHTVTFVGTALPNGIYIVKLVIGSTNLNAKVIKDNGISSGNVTITFKNDVLVFPNPTYGKISIKVNNIQNKSLKVNIHDNVGRMVFASYYTNGDIEIDLSELNSGVYTVSIPELNFNNKLVLTK